MAWHKGAGSVWAYGKRADARTRDFGLFGQEDDGRGQGGIAQQHEEN